MCNVHPQEQPEVQRQDLHELPALRQALKTHQVVTVILATESGKVLRIRKGTTPESIHQEIYKTLKISGQVMTPVRAWTQES